MSGRYNPSAHQGWDGWEGGKTHGECAILISREEVRVEVVKIGVPVVSLPIELELSALVPNPNFGGLK